MQDFAGRRPRHEVEDVHRKGVVEGSWASEKTSAAEGGGGPTVVPEAIVDRSPERVQLLRAASQARIDDSVVTHDRSPEKPSHDAGRGSVERGRHQPLFDSSKKRVDAPKERSDPSHFLGPTKKRVESADARMFGTAAEPVPGRDGFKMFDTKRPSSARPPDHTVIDLTPTPDVQPDDPFLKARACAYASNVASDGRPIAFASTAAMTPRGRGGCRPVDHGNLVAHDALRALAVDDPTPRTPQAAPPPPVDRSPERPQSASLRHAHTPRDRDIFQTQLPATRPLPDRDPAIFQSKGRVGPFTPRDSLGSHGQFS
jgi:hypothetical protein